MSGSSGGGEQALTDWSDLLRPDLRGRVAFSDSPRDLLTAALGCLGLPPSPPPGTEIDPGALRGAVLALRRQALTFDGRDHVRALAAGDALADPALPYAPYRVPTRTLRTGTVVPAYNEPPLRVQPPDQAFLAPAEAREEEGLRLALYADIVARVETGLMALEAQAKARQKKQG